MSKINFNSSGQIARMFLVLAIIVFVAIIITFLVVRMAEKPAKPAEENEEEAQVPLPVYEQQLGNIRFIFQSARDFGDTLMASEAINEIGSQKNLTTTEKFIEVSIGAQNKGTVNTERGAWDIGNIIDSKGRNFEPLEGYQVNAWLPQQSGCGALLKPSFDPISCVKIYEVSKEAEGLKIQVMTGENNNSAGDFSAGRKQAYLLDLIVK